MRDLSRSQWFEALMASTTDAVAVVDSDGVVRARNDAFEAFFPGSKGHDPATDAEHAGDPGDATEDTTTDSDDGVPADAVDEDDARASPETWPACFEGDPPDLDELADTDDAVTRELAGPVANGAGHPIGDGYTVGISVDRVADAYLVTVTDEQVPAERDQFRNILESVKDGIYMLNGEGRIEYVNQAVLDAHDMTYDREDMVGEFATALLPAGDVEACVEAIQSLIVDDDAESAQVGVTIQDADGKEIPAELNLSLLPPEDGEFTGSVGVLRDVSERRRRDQMLRVLNRVLRHNLRNDMNVVAGLAQLTEAQHPEMETVHLERIREVAADLVELGGKARVVEDLTGRSARSTQAVDVVPIVEGIVEDVAAKRTASDVSFDAPATAVASVPPMFETAVSNVVENAFEHGTDPTVAVSVRSAAGGDTVEVEVRDDGPGIPTAEIEALRSETETPLEHASGLGLWLTDWIVEFADGEVAYDIDDGTTVTISLPCSDDEYVD